MHVKMYFLSNDLLLILGFGMFDTVGRNTEYGWFALEGELLS